MEILILLIINMAIALIVFICTKMYYSSKYEADKANITKSFLESLTAADSNKNEVLDLAEKHLRTKSAIIQYLINCLKFEQVPRMEDLSAFIDNDKLPKDIYNTFKPKLIINITGGIFQWSQSNVPIDLIVLDSDIAKDMDNETSFVKWTSENGKEVESYLFESDNEVRKESTHRIHQEIIDSRKN